MDSSQDSRGQLGQADSEVWGRKIAEGGAVFPFLSPFFVRFEARLHAVVVGSAAAFGWDPGDDLVGVHDVAGLAVDAVGGVQADVFGADSARRRGGIIDHFVDVGGAEVGAGVAEFFGAARVADVGVLDDEVRWLVFLVLGAGVVEVGELVEGELAVAFGVAEQMLFGTAVDWERCQRPEVFVAGVRGVTSVEAAAEGDLLEGSVDEARVKALLEALMKIADLPKFFPDPALID